MFTRDVVGEAETWFFELSAGAKADVARLAIFYFLAFMGQETVCDTSYY